MKREPDKNPKIIVIRFGDNDFHSTMRAFGLVLSEAYLEGNWAAGFLTKERIVGLWNVMAPPLYLVAQNGGRYGDANNYLHVSNYLQITTDKVLLDDDAKAYYEKHSWNNSESLWVDLGDDYNVPTVMVF